ncbi:MAG: YitT family protein [Acutalibacteraceae bacterium]
MRKIKISKELAYFLAIVLLSFAVAMISCTNFGVSMIVAPAYILSQKVSFLTFGTAEYIVQGILFVIFCALMKKVRLSYFCSFLTGVIYGAILDLWRLVIPHFNPDITAPGSLPMWIRIVYFILGMLLTSFSVSLFFQTYLYPQVYDFFVKGVSEKYQINRTKFKTGFDMSCLAVSVIMSLLLFHKFVGVGVGTLIMACMNGTLIGFFSKVFDKYFAFFARFKKLEKFFEI